MTINRRQALKAATAFTLLPALSACNRTLGIKGTQNILASEQDWLKAKVIRANIVVPAFNTKTFNITDFGAKTSTNNDCTIAINSAIKHCHEQGGGRVIVPAGNFHTGAVHLLSNVNLHIEQGASLHFLPHPQKYLPAVLTRWEGMELMGYSPLIYAYQQKNIAITGTGTLDGGGSDQLWWPWKGQHNERHWDIIPGQDQAAARNQLMADVEAGVPAEQRRYAEGAFLRPPFVQPYQCENVLIEGVTIKNSPFWLINPVLCKSVTIRNVNLDSHGPNSDGCDPESCDHVLIENCTFNTGDDCIAIKSGRNADGRRLNVPSQNIVIANCNMRDGHGGVVIGSEISGGVNNVFVENCKMNSPLLERAIRIKTNSVRGGLIEHIRIRNIDVGVVQNAVVINFFYEEGDAGRFDPTVRDIVIENINCQKVLQKPLYLQGFARAPMSNITLKNCHFKESGEASIVSHVNNITLDNVSINGKIVNAQDIVS